MLLKLSKALKTISSRLRTLAKRISTKRNRQFLSVFLAFSAILILVIGACLFSDYGKEPEKASLAKFSELTAKDPLFYSPFFDKENFTQAINDLAKAEDELKKVIVKNTRALPIGSANNDTTKNWYISATEKTELFPHQLLRDLAYINSTTEEFLKNPSTQLGQKLLDSYDNAADAYLRSVSALIEIPEQSKINKIPTSYFFFVDSFSSSEIALNDLKIIRENGYALKKEIQKRRDCLANKAACPAPSKTKNNESLVDSLDTKFDLSNEKVAFIKNNFPISNFSRIKGPYRIDSSCWRSPNLQQWMYLVYSKQDNKVSIIPKLANQNYYYEVSSPAKNKVEQILLDRDLKFNLQLEANTYECMNLNFYPQLLTLDFLKDKIDSGQITANNLNSSDYRLLIENQFGLIAPAINTVSAHLDTMRLHLTTNQGYFPPNYLFLTRSIYSIFYFPFAKSIWRIDKQLQYFASENEKPLGISGQRFFTIDDLMNQDYTLKEIAKFDAHLSSILETLPENQSTD